MMKDNVSSAKLKGTVLFTVVSVLMVLIVFLMGTLALAATASNRAYGNYQKEQTEYTARAVLDSVVQAINEDTTTNGIKYQMAYSLTSQASNPLSVTVEATDGLQATVSIANAGTKQVYSETQGTWVSGTVYELSTTIDRTMAGTTYRAYIIDEKLAGNGGGGGGGGAFVSLGGVSGKIGTSGFTAGGTEIGIGTDGQQVFEFDNTSVQMAPFYVHGSLILRSQTTMQFNKVGDAANQKPQFIAVTGDLTLKNNFDIDVSADFEWPDSTVDYTEVPSLYVGGTLKQEQSDTLFNTKYGVAADIPINVYCGRLITNTVNQMAFQGDLFLFDEAETSLIYNNNYYFNHDNDGNTPDVRSTLLYQWINNNATITNAPNAGFGNLYSAGNVEIGGPNIEGVVRVAKNLTITGKNDETYTFNNNVVVGGTLKLNDNFTRYKLNITGNLYADKLEVTGGGDAVIPTIITCYGNIDINNLAITGSGKVQIRCDNIRIKNYTYNPNVELMNLAGVPYTGADTTAATYVPAQPAETEVAKKAGLDTEGIYPKAYLEGEVKKKIVTVPSATQYDNYPSTLEEFEQSMGTSLNSITTYATGWNPNYPEIPDTITTNCRIVGAQWGSGWDKDILLKPTGTMLVIIDELSMSNGHNIIIDDSQGEVYFFITKHLSLNAGGDIITKDYQTILANAASQKVTIKEVQPDSSSDYYPNVYIFADDVVEPNNPLHSNDPNVDKYAAYFNSNNSGSIVTAHVRAPGLKFSMDNGMTGSNVVYQQETSKLDSNGNAIIAEREFASGETIGVIGQLICGNISVTNQWGMIYVTLPSNGCACCAKCTGVANCPCITNGCTCASCTCSGGGGGGGVTIPDKFATMYYNYF